MFPSGEYVSFPGGNATFVCTSTGMPIRDITWMANTTELKESFNTTIEFADIGLGVGTLMFINITINYNNTEIKCRANHLSGAVVESNIATLLVLQGT